ncbi:MAG: alpha/beta fold hydrolase [Candidatus Rokubacteria bacterium]|nr:alpha/beta fold hydrolase [Candidatus Rokubacteria bacterium]
MDRISAGEVGLAVRVWPGGEPTIVGVHGLTANHTCWYPVADALAPGSRFIAYDLRGRGESDKPAVDYNLAAHTRDLLGLLDRFGLEQPVIMGHSLGAHIAVHLAAHHPERVSRLVLFDGGIDVRAEILDALGPSIGRLGVEFPSLDAFLA